MKRIFCDRCGKETKEVKRLYIGFGGSYAVGSKKECSVEICENCQKETGIFEFIDKNQYEEPLKQTEQETFFELFREMVNCCQN